MRFTHIWIIAGTIGALVGAAFTYYLTDNNPPTGSFAGVNQTESVLRDRKMDTPVSVVNNNWTQDSTAAHRDGQPMSSMKVEASSATQPPVAAVKKPDPAQEEAMVQVITSRLYDPSMTLADIMQSEEMLKLSDESREQVVAKMVGMLNRG